MRNSVWHGKLPRYWTDSLWLATVGGDILLLVPDGIGRLLLRVTPQGELVWKRSTISDVLLLTAGGLVITARVRDGRSDAVYYQFTAHDLSQGESKWELAPSVQVRRPKWVISPFSSMGENPPLVLLDIWRDVHTGDPYLPGRNARGIAKPTATWLEPTSHGLKVTWLGCAWELPGGTEAQVKGIKDSLLVGQVGRTLWVRDLLDGGVRWRVDLDSSVVEPSRYVAGLDEDLQIWRDSVPAVAVMHQQRMAVLRAAEGGVALCELPKGNQLAHWEAGAVVALVGAVPDGYLVVQENTDGTGCLWCARKG
jgi:hypothetical protein